MLVALQDQLGGPHGGYMFYCWPNPQNRIKCHFPCSKTVKLGGPSVVLIFNTYERLTTDTHISAAV